MNIEKSRMSIEISRIIISDDRRKIDQNTVDKLAESMKQVGLMNPVTLDWGYNLIAGAHRVAAAKQLGWTEIPCTLLDVEELQAKLAELDENLVRNQGSVIEQGEWLAEKKKIYEQLHPETKAAIGKDLVQKRWDTTVKLTAVQSDTSDKLSLVSETPSFVQDTADKTGLSKRTIERSIQIAENLTPEVKEFAKEVDLNKTNALELARKEPEEQRKIIEPIRSFVATVAPEERKETANRMISKEVNPAKFRNADGEEIDFDSANSIRQTYMSAVAKAANLEMKPENVRILYESICRYSNVERYLRRIEMALQNMQGLKDYFLAPPDMGGMIS